MNGVDIEYCTSEDAFASDLLLRVTLKERSAMEQLYGLFQDAVYRVALVRIGAPSTAAQLLHTLMLQTWAGTYRWSQGCRPRVAFLRMAARSAVGHMVATPDELDPSTLELLPAIDRNGIAENLHTALHRLPERYRTVLHLAYFEHLSDAEIAVVLDSSEDTVSWHRRQGRDTLSGLVRGPGAADARGRDLFLDAWMRRELRMPPDASPCDFGLDRLKLDMREAESRRWRRQMRRRWVQKPLAWLRRWFGLCAPTRRDRVREPECIARSPDAVRDPRPISKTAPDFVRATG